MYTVGVISQPQEIEKLKEHKRWQRKNEAKWIQEETEYKADLRPPEHKRTLKETYKSFVVPWLLRDDIDGNVGQVKSHIKALVQNQLRQIQSTNVIMTLWLRLETQTWNELLIWPWGSTKDIGNNTSNSHIRVEMPFYSFMIGFFEGKNIAQLMQCLFTHSKTSRKPSIYLRSRLIS